MHAIANAKNGLLSTSFNGNIAWLSAAVHWDVLKVCLVPTSRRASNQNASG
jgi:hypothetical protein